MNKALIVAIFLISAAPVYAQDHSIIKGDKVKIQVYCEINNLGEQIGEADQKKDDTGVVS